MGLAEILLLVLLGTGMGAPASPLYSQPLIALAASVGRSAMPALGWLTLMSPRSATLTGPVGVMPAPPPPGYGPPPATVMPPPPPTALPPPPPRPRP